MKIADLQKLSKDDLVQTLLETEKGLSSMRTKAFEGQLKDVRDIRDSRKTIARIKTILSQLKRVTV
jgi:large subunit ribosomal protein L29